MHSRTVAAFYPVETTTRGVEKQAKLGQFLLQGVKKTRQSSQHMSIIYLRPKISNVKLYNPFGKIEF